jgi:NADH-quinone oxidoreductase subunit C
MSATPFLLEDELRRVLGDKLSRFEAGDMPTVTVSSGDYLAALTALCDDSALGYRFLTSLFGMHLSECLGVQVLLHNLSANRRLRVITSVPIENPVLESLTSLFPSANWMERETYDFFGVRFTGHPNLKRILNIESMTVFPMRKDFPLEDRSRTDKDDRMFGR